jgi:hypothetical protein
MSRCAERSEMRKRRTADAYLYDADILELTDDRCLITQNSNSYTRRSQKAFQSLLQEWVYLLTPSAGEHVGSHAVSQSRTTFGSRFPIANPADESEGWFPLPHRASSRFLTSCRPVLTHSAISVVKKTYSTRRKVTQCSPVLDPDV